MKCEIISVGTELLLGNIVNTNSQYLSEKIAELGIDVYYHCTVGDNLERLKKVILESLERSDIVITTGGLGPTDDDLTKEGIAEALDLKLVPHEESIHKIENYFKSINKPMPKCNIKQGYIPENSIVIKNNNGTAPGVLIEKNGKMVIMLPGPPREMIPMFDESVYPYLKSKSKDIIKSKTIKIVGIGESAVQELLQEIFDNQTNPTVSPYAKEGEVHLRVTAKCSTENEADILIEEMCNKITSNLQENIYGFDSDTLEYSVYKLLKEKNMTISIAESCTGGLISGRLTNVPGVSTVFMNSIVTYSNEAKMKFLGVNEETLINYGAVSPETAVEMAEGIRKVSGTDIGVSVTGIAGPDGGTNEKPVGLFYIGIAIGEKVESYKFFLPGNRNKVRTNAVNRAFDVLRRELIFYREK